MTYEVLCLELSSLKVGGLLWLRLGCTWNYIHMYLITRAQGQILSPSQIFCDLYFSFKTIFQNSSLVA